MKTIISLTPFFLSFVLIGCPKKESEESLDAKAVEKSAEEQCLEQPAKIYKDGECLDMSTHKGGEIAEPKDESQGSEEEGLDDGTKATDPSDK